MPYGKKVNKKREKLRDFVGLQKDPMVCELGYTVKFNFFLFAMEFFFSHANTLNFLESELEANSRHEILCDPHTNYNF